MHHSLRRWALGLTLAVAACAKQQALPVADVGVQGDALTVATGVQIILDGSRSADPSGKDLTFDWSFDSLPPGSRAKIESPHTAKTRFIPDVPTTLNEKYVVRLVVKTQYFVSEPHLLTISAQDCGASVPQVNSVTASPTSINISTPVLLTAAVTDHDNDAACQSALNNQKQTEKYKWELLDLPPGSRATLRDPAAEKGQFVPDVPGTFTVALTVTDSTGRSSDTFRLGVPVADCGGAAPGIDSITSSPASPNLGQATQLTASVSDADVDNATCGLKQGKDYAWKTVGLPTGSAATLNDPSALNPSFTPDVPGDYLFTLVVTDSTGRSSNPKPFVVTVKDCGGAPPIPIVQFTPASAGVGTPVSLHVTPHDDDAACGIFETFTYFWNLVTVPSGSIAQIGDPTASTASFTPDVGGNYAIQVTITDSRGTKASVITNLNTAGCGANRPSVDSLTGLPLTPLTGQNVHVTAQVSDSPDSSCAGYDPTQTFDWIMSMRPAGSSASLTDPHARTADFVPDVVGHYQLRLVVKDATGLASDPALFDVQTSTCGHSVPQIVSVGASNPSPDPAKVFVLFAQVSDADNGGGCSLNQAISLKWVVSSRPAGSSATLSNPATPSPSFAADVPGSYQFSAVATDDSGLSSTPSFLTVNTTNCGTAIPTVAANPAAATVQPFQTVSLTATPFDADTSCGINETFTYAWKIVSAPAGSSAIISDRAAAAPTLVPDMGGAWLISLRVTDARGHVSPEAFSQISVTSCANLLPTTGSLSANPLPPQLGLPVTLSAPAARSNACGAGSALTYAWTLSGPAGSRAMLDNPAAAAPRFTPDVAGAWQAVLVVRDGHGTSSTAAVFNFSVAACGTSNLAWSAAPEISPTLTEPNGAPLTPSFAGGVWNGAFTGTSVALNANFIDPPGCGTASVQPFNYQWALVSRPAGSSAHLDASDVAMPSFTPDLPGDYQVAARVGDAMGAVLPTRFVTVHVPGCGTNSPVTSINITPPGTAALNTFQALNLTAGTTTDADAQIATCPARFAVGVTPYSFSWTVTPAGATLSPSSGAVTDFKATVPGTYTVSLVATTASGIASAPATQVITVGDCGSHVPAIAQVTAMAGSLPVSRPLVNQPVTVTAVATDPDTSIGGCVDSIASYRWTLASAPAGSLNAVTPAPGASFTVSPDVAGVYQYTVVAIDSFGLQSDPYTISLETGDCAPFVASITPSIGAPGINQPFTLTAAAAIDTCVAQPSIAYDWSIISAPAGSTARLGANGSISTGFTADRLGAYQFQVVATDQAGLSSPPVTLRVVAGTCGSVPPSLAPVVMKKGASVVSSFGFDAGDTLVLSSAVTDNNNASCGALTQPFHWHWTLLSRPAGSGASIDPAGATPSFVPDLPGSYQLSAQATDALGNVSNTVFLTATTSLCGINPVTASISPSGAQNVGINTPFALTATVTDADNSACPARFAVPLAQQWSVLTAPAGSHPTLSSTTTAATTFRGDVAGVYVVGLTGSASNGLHSPLATVQITAGDCGATPPQILSISSSAGRPAVGSPVTLTANAVDPDNLAGGTCGSSPLSQTLTFTWRLVSGPAGATVDTSSSTSTLAFSATAAGTYTFEATARDSAGFVSQAARISVPTGACAPGLTGISVTPGASPTLGSTVSLAPLPSATPPDACVATGNSYTYLWSVSSRPLSSSAAVTNATSAAPTFKPDVPGAYILTLTLTDAAGFSAQASATVVAQGCGTGPAVSLLTPRSFEPGGAEVTGVIHRGDAVMLRASVSGGACGTTTPDFTYEWSILSRPPGSASVLDDPSAPSPSFTADAANGTWQVMVVVRDSLGSSTTTLGTVSSDDCGTRKPVIAGLPASVSINTFQPQAFSISQPPADPEAGCPARFSALPISYSWTVSSQPAGVPAPTLTANGPNATFTPQRPGPYQVRASATGSDGTVGTATVAVTALQCGYNTPVVGTITGAQSAPVVNASPFNARNAITFSAPVTDADDGAGCGLPSTPFARQWTLLTVPPGSTAQLALANTSAPTLVPDLPGTYLVTLAATDETGLIGNAATPFSFTVSATCGTHAPAAVDTATPAFRATQVLTPTNTLQTSTLSPGTLAIGFPVTMDPPNIQDGDTVCSFPASFTYAWTLDTPAGSASTLTGASTATPGFIPDVTGPYVLSMTVTDTTGLSSTQTFSIDVGCGAAGPITQDSGGTPAFKATQTVSGLNVAGQSGPQTLTITRTTIAGTGAPNVNSDVQFFGGQPVTISAPGAQDGDSSCGFPQTISYAWDLASAPAGSLAVLNAPNASAPSFVPDLPGSYDLRLTLTDSTGRSNTQIFPGIVAVSSCGLTAPTASVALTSPISVAAPMSSVSLPIGNIVRVNASSSSDPDNAVLNLTATDTPAGTAGVVSGCGLSQTLTYKWTVFSAPAGAQPLALSSSTVPNPSFSMPVGGNYGLELAVNDGERVGKTRITVRARGIGNATLTANPASGVAIVGPGNGTTLTLTVLDTDGNPLAAVPATLAVTAGFTGTNTLATPTGTTDSQGQVTSLFTATKAGTNTKAGESKTVEASSAGTTLASVTVAFLPDQVNDIFWFKEPCDGPAGTTICGAAPFPEVDGEDQFGNVVSNYNSTVTLTAVVSPANSTVSGTLQQPAGSQFPGLNVDTNGSYQFLATVPENLPGPTPAKTGLPPAFGVLSRVFIATAPPPNPPVVTSSTATVPNQIRVDWQGSLNNSNNRDHTILQYHVFRAVGAVTPSALTFAQFTDVATPTIAGSVCGGPNSFKDCHYTDTSAGLTDGTQFTYYIAADNTPIAQGACTFSTCPPSNIVQQYTVPGVATSVTTDASTTAGTVNLSWRPPAAGIVSSYDVLSSSTSGGTYTAVATGITTNCALPSPACTFSDTGVGNNTQVFYKIQTNITLGTAPATAPSSNLTAAFGALTLPGPVQGLATSAVTHNSVSLTWTAQAGISSYKVFRGTTTAGSYVDTFTVGTNSFVNNAATNSAVYPGVGYHYAVVAVNATGSSPGTPTDLPVTTPAAPWVASNSGLPGGGFLNAIGAHPLASGNGVVYAGTGKLTDATTAGGIFKFTPAASTWSSASNGIPNGAIVTAYAFDVVAGTRIYAGTRGQGVFTSLDNGVTWNPVAATGLGNGTITALWVDANRTLWAGGDGSSGGGIFSLALNAPSWTTSKASPTQTVQAFAEDLNTTDLWAQLGGGATASPAGGLWHFTGGTWTLDANQPSLGATDCSLTRANASAFAIDSNPGTSVLYWGSKSCGLLFRPVTPVATVWANVVGYTTTEITRLLVLDADPKIWVASAEVGAGNGVTFLQPSKAPAQQVNHMTNAAYPGNDWEPTALASDPRTSRTNLWAGSQDGTGAYLSTNATASGAGVGGSFTKTNTGLSNINVRSILRDTDNTHLVAAGDLIGVATSADQGATWSSQTLTGCTTVVSLAYDTANGLAFATCQGVQGVYVSAANGTGPWTKKNCTGLPATPTFTRGIAVFAASTDILYLATAGAAPSTPATIWKTDASTGGGGNPGNTCTAVATLPSTVQDVSAIGVDQAGDVFAGSANNFVATLAVGAGNAWVLGTTGPKNVVRFFLNTTGTDAMLAAGQDDGTNLVGGVWTSAPGTITNTTTVAWTLVPAVPTSVTGSSVVTGFNGLVPNTNPPILFAGTALAPGQQYANMFRFTSGNWTAAGDGLNGGNVLGVTLPNANNVAVGSAHVLAGTTAGGIFKTTSGGQ